MKKGRRTATPSVATTSTADAAPGAFVVRMQALKAEALCALALLLLYLAVMSGHLSSMDGLYMARQADALLFDHSVKFERPVWTWREEPAWNSIYGIGLSLAYVPGMLVAAPMRSMMPVSMQPPRAKYAFYMRELYEDRLYTAGASWLHAWIAAVTAFLVACLTRFLGFDRRAALWAMALYGIGSPAFVYSRGDFAQPLEGLCWIAAVLASIAYRRGGGAPALAACAAAIFWAILVRPLEGVLIVPIAAALSVPNLSELRGSPAKAIAPLMALAGGAAAAVGGTLLVNQARFGGLLEFGYPEGNRWVFPDLERWAAVLVSPGRGILWEFPAILLVPLGAACLLRKGLRREAVLIVALSAVLLTNVASWFAWWGGWCWGLRLLGPAIPLLAVLAGVGTTRLRERAISLVPMLLLAAGFVWALPGVFTDILGGFASGMDTPDFTWRLSSYPPYGAWRFLERAFPVSLVDANTVDILWFRLAPITGYWSLAVPVALLAAAAALLTQVRSELARTPGET